jgi:uncharacterized protein YifE (UPF0438 family)
MLGTKCSQVVFSVPISINKEIRELESHIAAEGDAELKNLQAALEKEEANVKFKKEESKSFLKILDVVNEMVSMAERFWDKKRQAKDKKEEVHVSPSNELSLECHGL